MSTKIYNGWRIEGTDMIRLLKKLKAFRSAVKIILRKRVCDETARQTAFAIDMFRLLGKKTPVTKSVRRSQLNLDAQICSEMMFKVRDDIIHDSFDAQTREYNTFECDIVAIPVMKRNAEFTLLLLYDNTPGGLYAPDFARIVGAREYGYWNNTDRPSDVCAAEWRQRERDWGALGYGATATQGFTYSSVTRYDIPIVTRDETFQCLPLTAERRKNVYKLAVEDLSTEKAVRRLKRGGKKIKFISDVWDESRRWLKTKAGQRFKQKLWMDVQKKVKRITKSDYTAPTGTYAKEDKSD